MNKIKEQRVVIPKLHLKHVALALVLGATLVLSGCASWYPQTNALLASESHEKPARYVIKEVPFFAQTSDDCGPATLAMMLAHLGYQVSPERLTPLVYLPERGGSVPVEMMAAGRRFDLMPYSITPSLKNLIREVRAGNPVLVLQNLGFSWAPTWHYALVVGFDLDEEAFYLHSGEHAYQAVSFTRLERTWLWSRESWGMVLMPAGQLPATASPLELTQSIEALAVTGHAEAALKSYLAAVDRWPDDRLLGLALANLQYQRAHYRAAANAYLNLLASHPAAEEAWNNLAYALAQLGCRSALESALCALKLAPGNTAIRSSGLDIQKILRKQQDVQPSFCPALPVCPLEAS